MVERDIENGRFGHFDHGIVRIRPLVGHCETEGWHNPGGECD